MRTASQLCGGGTTNYEYWDSVPLPQNLRMADFINISAIFTTAGSVAFVFALLTNNSEIN